LATFAETVDEASRDRTPPLCPDSVGLMQVWKLCDNVARSAWSWSRIRASRIKRRLVWVMMIAPLVSPAGESVADSVVVIQNNGAATVIENSTGTTVIAEGANRTEERNPGSYSSVELDAPAIMTFSVSGTPSLKVTAPANILPLVTTDVKDQRLIVRLHGSVVMQSPISISASAPTLDSAHVAGTGTVRATGVRGDTVDLSVSGAGSIGFSGAVGAVRARISGSGEIDASAVCAQRVVASVAGSGSIAACASQSVSANIAGSGDIVVTGNPPERQVSAAGSGRVYFR
jgi:hypothetical protein